MTHNLNLQININPVAETFDVTVTEPESGETLPLGDFDFMPDEHPCFTEEIAREIYSWIAMWMDNDKEDEDNE